jgi:hypothetical protein
VIESPLSLVVTSGERAVCHAVDPALPAGQLASELALYFGAPPPIVGRWVWRSAEGARPLDPEAPIGSQIHSEAEIDIEPQSL